MDRNIPTFYENTGFKFNRKKAQTVTLYLNNDDINSDGTFEIKFQDALKIDKLSDLYLDSFSTSYFKSNTGIILNPVAPAATGDTLPNRDSAMTAEQLVLSLGNQLPLQVSGVDSSSEHFDVGEKVTYYHNGLAAVDAKSILHYNSGNLKITLAAIGVAAGIDLGIRDSVATFKDFADITVGDLVKLTVNTGDHLTFTGGGTAVPSGQVFRVLTKVSPNITLAFIGSDTALVFDSITGVGISLGDVEFELYSDKIDTNKELYIKEKDNSNYKFSETAGGVELKIAGGHENNILIRKGMKAFNIKFDQFNIQTVSNAPASQSKLVVTNTTKKINEYTSHKSKKMNFICSINPIELRQLSGKITDENGGIPFSKSPEFYVADNYDKCIMIELVIVPRE